MDNISINFRVNSIRNYLRFAKNNGVNVLVIMSGHVKNVNLPAIDVVSADVSVTAPLHNDKEHAAYEIVLDHQYLDDVSFNGEIMLFPTSTIRSIYDCTYSEVTDTKRSVQLVGDPASINEITVRKIVILTDKDYKYTYNFPIEYLPEELEMAFSDMFELPPVEEAFQLIHFPTR